MRPLYTPITLAFVLASGCTIKPVYRSALAFPIRADADVITWTLSDAMRISRTDELYGVQVGQVNQLCSCHCTSIGKLNILNPMPSV